MCCDGLVERLLHLVTLSLGPPGQQREAHKGCDHDVCFDCHKKDPACYSGAKVHQGRCSV